MLPFSNLTDHKIDNLMLRKLLVSPKQDIKENQLTFLDESSESGAMIYIENSMRYKVRHNLCINQRKLSPHLLKLLNLKLKRFLVVYTNTLKCL